MAEVFCKGDMIPTVIYDARCGFCESTKEWISRWGRHRPLRFLHFEDPRAYILQPDLRDMDYLETFRFLDGEGKVWKGSDAAIQLLKILPFGKPLALFFSLPGAYRLAERTYGWFAQNRHRLFSQTH